MTLLKAFVVLLVLFSLWCAAESQPTVIAPALPPIPNDLACGIPADHIVDDVCLIFVPGEVPQEWHVVVGHGGR